MVLHGEISVGTGLLHPITLHFLFNVLITSRQQFDFLFLGSRWWLQSWNQKSIASWQECHDKPRHRNITLPTKVHIVKAMDFPVVTYDFESWIIKKAEHQRTDAFQLWCWKRLLRVPWTARRSNWSILREINSEYYTHWKDWYWSWSSSILVTWCD